MKVFFKSIVVFFYPSMAILNAQDIKKLIKLSFTNEPKQQFLYKIENNYELFVFYIDQMVRCSAYFQETLKKWPIESIFRLAYLRIQSIKFFIILEDTKVISNTD